MIKKHIKTVSIIIVLSISVLPGFVQGSWNPPTGYDVSATLALTPSVGTYRAATGVTFELDIIMNTQGQQVVSATAIISYNSSLFSINVLDCNDASKPSVFYVGGACQEIEKSAANNKIRITRGILATNSPGYINTANGRFATLRITGLADTVPTSDNFTFDFAAGNPDLSNIFLKSPLGSPTLSGVNNGKYTLDGTPPANVANFNAAPGKGQISLSWTNPGSDFSGVVILRKTGSYPTSVTDGTQIYNSNGTSYIDTGLTNGTTYYYKAFSRDGVLNYSSGAQVSAAPTDNVVPGQINNLAVTNLTNIIALKTAVLNWTAVGDDGTTGTAASYDIRYSTAAITATNFASATQVSGEPVPKASGSAETMSVSGLAGSTAYYWAIKAIDTAGNSSALSNVVSLATYPSADLNNSNGLVNGQDFSVLLGWWLDRTKPVADINQSGEVNGQDFSIMMGQWTG